MNPFLQYMGGLFGQHVPLGLLGMPPAGGGDYQATIPRISDPANGIGYDRSLMHNAWMGAPMVPQAPGQLNAYIRQAQPMTPQRFLSQPTINRTQGYTIPQYQGPPAPPQSIQNYMGGYRGDGGMQSFGNTSYGSDSGNGGY